MEIYSTKVAGHYNLAENGLTLAESIGISDLEMTLESWATLHMVFQTQTMTGVHISAPPMEVDFDGIDQELRRNRQRRPKPKPAEK